MSGLLNCWTNMVGGCRWPGARQGVRAVGDQPGEGVLGREAMTAAGAERREHGLRAGRVGSLRLPLAGRMRDRALDGSIGAAAGGAVSSQERSRHPSSRRSRWRTGSSFAVTRVRGRPRPESAGRAGSRPASGALRRRGLWTQSPRPRPSLRATAPRSRTPAAPVPSSRRRPAARERHRARATDAGSRGEARQRGAPLGARVERVGKIVEQDEGREGKRQRMTRSRLQAVAERGQRPCGHQHAIEKEHREPAPREDCVALPPGWFRHDPGPRRVETQRHGRRPVP